MIADVKMLAVPGISLSNGWYPLFEHDHNMNRYTKATFPDVKVTPDLEQTRQFPEFDGWEDCNMVMIDDRLYWVVASRTATNRTHTIEYDLSYCAPSDLFKNGDTMHFADAQRIPANLVPYLKQAVGDDAMKVKSHQRIKGITERMPDVMLPYLGDYRIVWVEIVTTERFQNNRDVSQDPIPQPYSSSNLRRYGFHTAIDPYGNESTAYLNYEDSTVLHPRLYTLMNDPEYYGFSPDSIKSISVSDIDPWGFQFIAYTGTPSTITEIPPKLNGTSETQRYFLKVIQSNSNVYGFITIEDYFEYGQYASDIPYEEPRGSDPSWESTKFTFNNNYDVHCGQFAVSDVMGEPISELPSERMTYYRIATDDYPDGIYNGGYHTLYHQAVSDYTGITVHIGFNQARRDMAVPMPKMSWVGDAWEQYRIRSWATDREQMQYAKDNAMHQLAQGLIMSGINSAFSLGGTAITAGATGAGIGVGQMMGAAQGPISAGVGGVFNYLNVARSAKQTLTLTEHILKASAGTGYMNGDGLYQLIMMVRTGVGLIHYMPANISDDHYGKYVKRFGYPAQGTLDVIVREGFYQGRITEDITGIRADRMDDLIEAGFRFIYMDPSPTAGVDPEPL